jgi:hypothetical protein
MHQKKPGGIGMTDKTGRMWGSCLGDFVPVTCRVKKAGYKPTGWQHLTGMVAKLTVTQKRDAALLTELPKLEKKNGAS